MRVSRVLRFFSGLDSSRDCSDFCGEKCRRRLVSVAQVIKAPKVCLLMVVAMFSIMSMEISSKFLESMFLLFVQSVEALMASSGEFFKLGFFDFFFVFIGFMSFSLLGLL